MRTLWRWLRGALMTVGAVVLLVTFTPLTYWWATALAGSWTDPKGEILVVLGGGLERDGFPAQDTLRRTLYALLVWGEGGFRKVLICGGAPDGQRKAVAAVMRDYLAFSGVPAEALSAETASQSTLENARNARTLLLHETGRIVLLTSDYHMMRAYGAFSRAGLRVQPRPVPDIRSRYEQMTQRWTLLSDLLRETVKLAYYKFRGWA